MSKTRETVCPMRRIGRTTVAVVVGLALSLAVPAMAQAGCPSHQEPHPIEVADPAP